MNSCENISVEDIANTIILGNKVNAETYNNSKIPLDIMRKLESSNDFFAFGLKFNKSKSERGKETFYIHAFGMVDTCSKRTRMFALSQQPNINIGFKSDPTVEEIPDGQEYYLVTNSNKPVGEAMALSVEGYKSIMYIFPNYSKHQKYGDTWMISPAEDSESHTMNFLNFLYTNKGDDLFPRVGRYNSSFCSSCKSAPDSYFIAFKKKNICNKKFTRVSLNEIEAFYKSLDEYSTKKISPKQLDIYYNGDYIGLAVEDSLEFYQGTGYHDISIHFFREKPI